MGGLLFTALILLGLTVVALFSLPLLGAAVGALTIAVGVTLTTALTLMSLSLLEVIEDKWCQRGLALTLGTMLGQTGSIYLADLVATGFAKTIHQLLMNSAALRGIGSFVGWFGSHGVCK